MHYFKRLIVCLESCDLPLASWRCMVSYKKNFQTFNIYATSLQMTLIVKGKKTHKVSEYQESMQVFFMT